MNLVCPGCGSKELRLAHCQSLWERFVSIAGYCPIRCKNCGLRFRQGILWLPGMAYARCPQCLREDLTDWEEKYRYPPRYQQMLLHLGARAHRCGPCRNNFVSFRPRRRQYVPSWRQERKEPGVTQDVA
jgi:hypothetical protein